MNLLTCILAVMPVFADAQTRAPQAASAIDEPGLHRFEEDVAEASASIRDELRRRRIRNMTRQVFQAARRQDAVSAQKALDQLLKEVPSLKEKPGTWLAQGEIHFRRGNFDGAFQEADRSIREMVLRCGGNSQVSDSPEKGFISDAYFNRGAALMHLGRLDEAIADMDAAYALLPRPHIQLNKCRALIARKKYEEAAKAYELTAFLDAKTAECSDKKRICAALSQNGQSAKACR